MLYYNASTVCTMCNKWHSRICKLKEPTNKRKINSPLTCFFFFFVFTCREKHINVCCMLYIIHVKVRFIKHAAVEFQNLMRAWYGKFYRRLSVSWNYSHFFAFLRSWIHAEKFIKNFLDRYLFVIIKKINLEIFNCRP